MSSTQRRPPPPPPSSSTKTPTMPASKPKPKSKRHSQPIKLAISRTTPHTAALRATLNKALLKSGGIYKLQRHLIPRLKHSAWAENVRRRCIELLDQGLERDEVLRMVRTEVRTLQRQRQRQRQRQGAVGKAAEGEQEEDGLCVPESVHVEGTRMLRGALEEVGRRGEEGGGEEGDEEVRGVWFEEEHDKERERDVVDMWVLIYVPVGDATGSEDEANGVG
ncbi:MAG: hypothetical protein M1816_001008 [Peltula sp. TS41687]|nr:MAG: hypothetical protein M1816_001008 [Peltula sp. TS41687]